MAWEEKDRGSVERADANSSCRLSRAGVRTQVAASVECGNRQGERVPTIRLVRGAHLEAYISARPTASNSFREQLSYSVYRSTSVAYTTVLLRLRLSVLLLRVSVQENIFYKHELRNDDRRC